VRFEGKLVDIFEDLLNNFVGVLAHDVARCFTGWASAKKVDLNLH
jgi:hypothetical protein